MSFHQFPVRFGKYIMLDRISAGGMAEVYRAKEIRENGFSRIIAIKSMLPGVANDAAMEPMFVDEAKLAARLAHPNIAQTYELGRIDDALYIAMELVWGRDLKTIAKACTKTHTPFPVPIGCYVVAKAAEALDFAHNALGADGKPMRLVHRDVSPHNLMLDIDGEVKVIDFGVAKADAKSSETVAGVIKGKFSYMAPEQVMGGAVDARTDVFALGIVLYELLSRERLYDGSSAFSIFDKVVNQDAPRLSDVIACPPELDAIVAKCLAKKAVDRFESAGQLADALSPFLIQDRSIVGPRDAAQLLRTLFPGDEAEMRERIQRYQAISERDCIDSQENLVVGGGAMTQVLVRGDSGVKALRAERSQGSRGTGSRSGGGQSRPGARHRGARDARERSDDAPETSSPWPTDNDAPMAPTAMHHALDRAPDRATDRGEPPSRSDGRNVERPTDGIAPTPPQRSLAVAIGVVALVAAAASVVGVAFKQEIIQRLGIVTGESTTLGQPGATLTETGRLPSPPASAPPTTTDHAPPAASPVIAGRPPPAVAPSSIAEPQSPGPPSVIAEPRPPPVGTLESTDEPPLAHGPPAKSQLPAKAKAPSALRDPAVGFAFVSIKARGASTAKVFIDGKEIGYSPVVGHRLKTGPHAVKIVPYKDEMPGKPKTQTFNLGKEWTQGAPMRLVIDLES